jgi:hypothetical protein
MLRIVSSFLMLATSATGLASVSRLQQSHKRSDWPGPNLADAWEQRSQAKDGGSLAMFVGIFFAITTALIYETQDSPPRGSALATVRCFPLGAQKSGNGDRQDDGGSGSCLMKNRSHAGLRVRS